VGEREREEHVLQGGKAGIPEENADQSIFNFLSQFSEIPTGSSQLGVGGGGPTPVTDLCRGDRVFNSNNLINL
jgi:hypothetical protein